ncbi:DUF421 domain-containing protein [Bradyrhizobium sp. 83002]|uniref:DUF421 domain-containing protein n=1 Tax=Bradyrhizobium aeschynomenes TaxID=2734909 RepID=UPI0015575E4D|nr:YetF domain-containing protein [Bradyrhizobium aeschynomenes]NPU13159.1 DUF421 domain-containing protein [Bradyrhizobium aeschynomenes]
MFFTDWADLGRLLVVGIPAYIALVLFLRISGKRTLTKLNAFDLVITVALGSTLSAVLLNKSISLTEGVLAFGLLIVLQYCITWLSVRWRSIETIVKSEPTLLLHQGRFLDQAMMQQRITRAEVLSAIRTSGKGELSAILAVVLETDGSMSILDNTSGSGDALTVVWSPNTVNQSTGAP